MEYIQHIVDREPHKTLPFTENNTRPVSEHFYAEQQPACIGSLHIPPMKAFGRNALYISAIQSRKDIDPRNKERSESVIKSKVIRGKFCMHIEYLPNIRNILIFLLI